MISLIREGVRHDLASETFWVWAQAGNVRPSDQLLDAQGHWFPATSFTDLRPHLPAPPPVQASLGEFLLKAALVVGGVFVVYKVGQALLDEDFGGRSFPAAFRADKIADHVGTHGAFCWKCERTVRVRDLTLDHIVPWSKGGLTSMYNADVICGPCNSAKRDRAGLFDHLRGRSE